MRSEVEGFEKELTRAMRRVEAPAGLADAVMGRVAAPARSVVVMRRRWVGALAASLLVGGLLAGSVEHHRRVEERERAERDFARSLEITNQAISHARQQLEKAGVVLD